MSVTTLNIDYLRGILPRIDRQDLTSVTEGGRGEKVNLFMGIGMCSKRNGLSEGLPVDVMQMLIVATIMRQKISEERKLQSKIIILIANDMLSEELSEEVKKVTEIYIKSLKPLLYLLGIQGDTEIVEQSDLSGDRDYQSTLSALKADTPLKDVDADSRDYIREQAAITFYMHDHKNVGTKIGWILESTSLQGGQQAAYIKNWDEYKFDTLCKEIKPDSGMRYIYTRAGMVKIAEGGSIVEGAPYASYTRRTGNLIYPKKEVTLEKATKRVSKQWANVYAACRHLIECGIAKRELLPEIGERENSLWITGKMLHHWSTPPQKDVEVADA